MQANTKVKIKVVILGEYKLIYLLFNLLIHSFLVLEKHHL